MWPYRANGVGQWATEVPVSAMSAISFFDHQCSHECSSMNMAWPKMEPGPVRCELVRPLDRRDAVAADHLVELGHGLGAVNREWQVTLARRGHAVAQQILRARVDLHRRDHAGEPPARMLGQLVTSRRDASNFSRPRRLVPFVLEQMRAPHSHRADAKPGASKPRSPLSRHQLDPPRIDGEMSTRVVTPDRSSSQ